MRSDRPPFYRRLAFKLLLGFTVVLLGLTLLVAVPLNSAMRRQIEEDLRSELRAIAGTAALTINGDAHEQVVAAQLANGNGSDTPGFQIIKEQLMAVRDRNGLPAEHIYTFYRSPENRFVAHFGVMTHPKPFTGDLYDLSSIMRTVFEQGAVADRPIYSDNNGTWISAYAPIYNSAGEIVGILEVDRNAEEYLSRADVVTSSVIKNGSTALLIAALGSWIFLRRTVTGPIEKIHQTVLAIAAKRFDKRTGVTTGDEYEDLGESLDELAHQLQVASSVHSDLTPDTMPDAHGWHLAGRSIACDATAGDYYDAFVLPGDRVGVVIGDVTGHGLGPSLLMSAARGSLRALAEVVEEPDELVTKLDELVKGDLRGGRFITLLYGVLHADGRFVYCNAGHGPAVCVKPGSIKPLVAHRTPVGVPWFNNDDLATTLHLDAGDSVLLASDGVTEASNAERELYGDHRLHNFLNNRLSTAEQTIDDLVTEIANHRAGTPLSDDLTVVCIQRHFSDEACSLQRVAGNHVSPTSEITTRSA
ncbi:MAG: SpoIIE family protein phosphatase [Planctomycetota bacterium]